MAVFEVKSVQDIKPYKGASAVNVNECILSYMSGDMWFPTMWHFDMCRLRRASAASF